MLRDCLLALLGARPICLYGKNWVSGWLPLCGWSFFLRGSRACGRVFFGFLLDNEKTCFLLPKRLQRITDCVNIFALCFRLQSNFVAQQIYYHLPYPCIVGSIACWRRIFLLDFYGTSIGILPALDHRLHFGSAEVDPYILPVVF
jgi:hypothetical protein